jgi:hypothetical protein
MKVFDHAKLDAPLHADGLHINILEFVALIINMWFVLWATRASGAPLGGWILSLRTDNTSALSWLQHSAHAKNLIAHRLSRFLIQMILQAHFPGKIVSSHIPGKEKDEADCVSRPVSRAPLGNPLCSNAPTYGTARPIVCRCLYFARFRHCFRPTAARWCPRQQ